MNIKVHIFYPALIEIMNYPEKVVVNGLTVGDCLKDLIRQFPGSDKWIFDSRGQFLEQVFVFINAESTHGANVNDPVKESDVLILVRQLIGG